MRLTLRTMLAYMDEILEPDDAELIGRKITESEFANSLMQRTQDVARKPRLGCPPVSGRGLSSDPNALAEYLDNTMSSERVPEFERICLESDVHLAEVACCHQILSLVLPEPAETSPLNRDRLYKIAARVDAAETGQISPKLAAGPPAAALATPTRRAPEVPEYLRTEPQNRALRGMAWSILAVAAGILAFLAFAPRTMKDPAIAWLQGKSGAAPAVVPETPTADGVPAVETPTVNPIQEALEGNKPEMFEPRVDAVGQTEPPDDKTAQTPPPNSVANVGSANLVPDVSPSVNPVIETAPAPVPPLPDEMAVPTPKTTIVISEPPIDTSPAMPATPTLVKPEPAPPTTIANGPLEVGRYLGSSQSLLLQFVKEDHDWHRLKNRDVLVSGERLLVLPAFRASLSLSGGITMNVNGPASFSLTSPDAEGVQGIIVELGQFSLLTSGKSGAKLRLETPRGTGLITFITGDTSCAVEVTRSISPGEDPRQSKSQCSAVVIAAEGQLDWSTTEGATSLKSPAKLAVGGPGESIGADAPKWFDADSQTAIEKRGMASLAKALESAAAATVPKSISLTLGEQAMSHQIEVRGIALRCCSYAGVFQPVVDSLADPQLRNQYRWTTLDALRAAVSLHPDLAENAAQAFSAKFGANGTDLFRMLYGYTDAQLQAGADKQLVDLLSHNDLEYRVLGFYNLRQITGINDQNYQPEALELQRRAHVKPWEERRKTGKIRQAVGDKP